MNPIVKEKWLKALRSGEYKQGKHSLHNGKDNTFCCLGVLVDLYIKEKELEWKTGVIDKESKGLQLLNRIETAVLPDEVMKWAELKSENPEIEGTELAVCNDDECLSFKKIADLIEKHL